MYSCLYMCVLVFCVYVWLTPVGVYNLTAGSCSGLVIWSAASRCDAVWNHLRWPDQSIKWPLSTHTHIRSTLILLYYSLQQVGSRLYSHTVTSKHVSVIVWCKCLAFWTLNTEISHAGNRFDCTTLNLSFYSSYL